MKQLYFVDLNQDKSSINQYLSETLLEKISKNLEKNKKTLLYINKRGSYSLHICKDCSHIKQCKNCDVFLSVHSNPQRLLCHHCMTPEAIPLSCEKCNGTHLEYVGVGIEQIEQILKKLFQDKNIFRLDSDTMSSKTAKKEALENIALSDIIIGTKMITTGFNFQDISLIGVILLEQELQIPRYDTFEKVYSNIKQLIGRGGRKGGSSEVVIQTFTPKNTLLSSILYDNYKTFFQKILSERKLFSYPPFVEMVTIRYKHKDKQKSLEYIEALENMLLSFPTSSDFHIEKLPSAFKMNNQFFTKIIIKGENIRDFLQNIKQEILQNKDLSVIFES